MNSAADLIGKTIQYTPASDPDHMHWLAFDPSGLMVHVFAYGHNKKPVWDGTYMKGHVITGIWLRPEGDSISWHEDAFLDKGRLVRGAGGELTFKVTMGIDYKERVYSAKILPGLVAPGAKPPRTGRVKVTVNDKTVTGPWTQWDGFGFGVNSPAVQPGKATIVPDPFTPGATCVWVHDPESSKYLLNCPTSNNAVTQVGQRMAHVPEPPNGATVTWHDSSGNTVTLKFD